MLALWHRTGSPFKVLTCLPVNAILLVSSVRVRRSARIVSLLCDACPASDKEPFQSECLDVRHSNGRAVFGYSHNALGGAALTPLLSKSLS